MTQPRSPILYLLGKLLSAQKCAIVPFKPLSKGRGIDLDDGRLDEGLGTNELVVGSVVDDINDARLAGDGLGPP